jgi:hypothetical protein
MARPPVTHFISLSTSLSGRVREPNFHPPGRPGRGRISSGTRAVGAGDHGTGGPLLVSLANHLLERLGRASGGRRSLTKEAAGGYFIAAGDGAGPAAEDSGQRAGLDAVSDPAGRTQPDLAGGAGHQRDPLAWRNRRWISHAAVTRSSILALLLALLATFSSRKRTLVVLTSRAWSRIIEARVRISRVSPNAADTARPSSSTSNGFASTRMPKRSARVRWSSPA